MIGVFDSGFGGLSILKEIQKVLPDYHYVYLGDTARTPYGTRSPEVVYKFTQQAVDFLFAQDCELIIIACNTASADALRKIQREYLPGRYPNRRVIGVIIPTSEEAVAVTKNNRIGVLATEGTVLSEAFPRELHKLDSSIKVFQQSAPLLVPLVEAGEHWSKAADLILRKYLRPLLNKDIDTLILGCTHYSTVESALQKIIGKNIKIISEGKIVARKFVDYLGRHPETEVHLAKNKRTTFYTTDLTNRFRKLGGKFYGKTITPLCVDL